jgi:hypothetical protein
MRRRMFISLIGATAAAWPLMARAQQSSNRIPFVGVLWHAGSAEEEDVYLSVLVKAFNDLGYVEGENIHLDHSPSADNVSSGVLTQHKWLAYNEQVDRLNAIRVPMRGRRTGSPIGERGLDFAYEGG